MSKLTVDLRTEENERDFDYDSRAGELTVYLGAKKDLSAAKLRKAISDLDWKEYARDEVEISGDSLNDADLEVAYEIASLKSTVFEKYKTDYRAKDKIKEIKKLLVTKKAKALKFAERDVLISANKFCRDIVSQNASDINPGEMERLARKIAKSCPEILVKVIDHKAAKKQGMNCLVAVGAESIANSEPDFYPRMVVLEYAGKKKTAPHVALVGKGITYDTGGLCLKPTNYMLDMKSDMTGSATVLSVFKAIADLPKSARPSARVTGVLALAENAFGASSYKPGDVMTAYNGKTVQVVDTDAEGRLVLADAIAYASTLKPDQIIDFATLTGSIVAALGEVAAGAMTNDKKFFNSVDKVFKSEGENLWQMPIFDEYKVRLKSQIADLAHCSGRPDASVAGLFLQEFVGEVNEKQIPWLHLDIAGMGWWENDGLWAYKGATGFAVKSITRYLQSVK